MVAKIVVATDGSKASVTALEYAGELARLYESELIILNVIRTDVIITYRQIDRDLARERVIEEREENSKKIVGRAVNLAKRKGLKVEEAIRRGQPDVEIINFIKNRDDIKMLVMGAFGKNFLERQLVGSKTEGVLRKLTEIDVPIIVVPYPCKRCEPDVLRKIVVATDGSEASENALDWGAEVAKKYDSEIFVINILRRGIREEIANIREDREQISRDILNKATKRAGELGVNAEEVLKKGFVDREIVNFVKNRSDIVLVVMGAYGKNFIERQLVGSKTQGVLRKIPQLDVPLAVVPAPVKKEYIKVPIT